MYMGLMWQQMHIYQVMQHTKHKNGKVPATLISCLRLALCSGVAAMAYSASTTTMVVLVVTTVLVLLWCVVPDSCTKEEYYIYSGLEGIDSRINP